MYRTRVEWRGGHWGHLECGNGARMDFSAPPDLYGHEGVITPEDAFVGAVNMCVHMMFIWAAERFKIGLVSYECEAEGYVKEFIDRTSVFEKIVLRPKIRVEGDSAERVERALRLARKYSLVAQSITANLIIEPEIISE